MTIADQSDSNSELPQENKAHGEKTESGQQLMVNQEMSTEDHQPKHVEADRAEPELLSVAGESLPPVDSGESATSSETPPSTGAVETAEPPPSAESVTATEPALAAERVPVDETGPTAEPAAWIERKPEAPEN